MCFGAKASTTDRGKSVKGLIKEGKEYLSFFIYLFIMIHIYILISRFALVRVRIANRGQDAFKPEEYGDTITVERRFKLNGTNNYKIMNHLDQTVSSKKEELNDICDNMQIAVDNPLTILTQDTSRMFLANSSSADKYKVQWNLLSSFLFYWFSSFSEAHNYSSLKTIMKKLAKLLGALHPCFSRKQRYLQWMTRSIEPLYNQFNAI